MVRHGQNPLPLPRLHPTKAMEFYDVIATQRSVRRFQPTPVAPDRLDRLWRAVQAAPSACNLQPWRLVIVKSPAVRARLQSILLEWVLSAPVLAVMLGNRETAWRRDGQSSHVLDAAIATEHLVLAATAEGLGSCWICAFNRAALAQALKLSAEWEPVAVVPIGYPDDPSPRQPRKPLAELVHEL